MARGPEQKSGLQNKVSQLGVRRTEEKGTTYSTTRGGGEDNFQLLSRKVTQGRNEKGQ